MTPARRILNSALACLLAIAFVSLDFENDFSRLGPATARADDDGGGRSGGRSRSRAHSRNGNDGASLFRIVRKRKARPRRAARPAIRQARHEPGMLIARGLSETALATLATRGYSVIERHALGSGPVLVKLRIPRRMSLGTARRDVRAEEPGALVDFNHYYRPESDRCTGGRCLMRQISGWRMETRAESCTPKMPIGLIDTRINLDHPALAGSRITVLPLFKQEADRSGAHHGTAVAALFVGKGEVPGLLEGWELVAVDAFRKGDIATGMDLARAIDMLEARRVPIINMSLSGPDNLILAQTVADAVKRGTIVVAAAGNDGPRAKPAYPAAYPDVIAVTAVDSRKRAYRRAARGEHIDIAAPGVNVWTVASVKGQRPRSGTSFAAPFVTAAAAMILADNSGFTRREVEIVLENEADDLGIPGRDDVFGWGLLNVSAICRG